MDPKNSRQARWFSEEIHVHEPSLRAYLRSAFPWLTDVDDLVQDAFVRIWRAGSSERVRSGKAFLFKAARNAALDLYRRRRVLTIESVADFERLSVYQEGPGVAETVARNQELEILESAIRALPDRCRQVLTLRKIYGLSQREVAGRLGISEHTVEVQVANGLRRCERYLRNLGVAEENGNERERIHSV